MACERGHVVDISTLIAARFRLPGGLDGVRSLGPVLDIIPAAVYVCDADGLIVSYNARAAELWGREPQPGDPEQRYCGSLRLYHSDGAPLPHTETPMVQVLRDGVPTRDLEVVIERPDGSRITVLVNIAPLADERGRLVGAVNCFQDITERKWTEIELQCSRQSLEDFFENGMVGLHWVAADGTILRANQAELDLLGYRPEEYIGHHIAEFHADRTTIEDILTRLRCGEQLDKYEARLRAKDGSIKHVLISSNVRFQDGRFVNTRCFTLDVTERKRAEMVERRLAAIVESSDDAIVSKDLDGIITSWNEGAKRLFGYTADEVIGKPVLILIPLDHQDEESEILARIRRGERTDHYETVRQRKDGSLVEISLTVSPIKDSEGRVVGASKIARDITERKRAEHHRNLLMAELDHRVKNTLATVQSIVAATLGRGERVKVLAGRLAALAHAHGLLAASSWEGAGLAEIVETALAPLRSEDSERITIAGDDVRLWPQAAQTLSLTMHELATNAAKYGALSARDGRLKVFWEVAGQPDARRLTLRWMETDGPAVEEPDGLGFGSKLIESAIAYELDGEARIEYRPDGLRCTLTVPLPTEGQIAPPAESIAPG